MFKIEIWAGSFENNIALLCYISSTLDRIYFLALYLLIFRISIYPETYGKLKERLLKTLENFSSFLKTHFPVPEAHSFKA